MSKHALLCAALLFATPLAADEVESGIAAARAAYEAGEIGAATAEIDAVAALLAEIRLEAMVAALPAPQPGWTRENETASALSGDPAAGADYVKGDARVEIWIMADPLFVEEWGASIRDGSAASEGAALREVRGLKYIVDKRHGDLMTVLINNFLIRVRGDAPMEDKIALFEATDFEALEGM